MRALACAPVIVALASVPLVAQAAGEAAVTPYQANLTLRPSRVTDPSTGRERHISGDAPREGDIGLTHDLPARHLRWGVNYVLAEAAADFKIDEIEADTLGDRIDAFVEYKPSPLWTVRLYGKNLTNSAALRTRTFHNGLRGVGDITYLERRVLKSGPYIGLRMQRSLEAASADNHASQKENAHET